MPDLLLAMLAGMTVLVVVCLVLRWAARVEQRAHARLLIDRVYYPTRGRKAGVPPFRRRWASERRKAWYGRSGNGELIDADFDEWQEPDP